MNSVSSTGPSLILSNNSTAEIASELGGDPQAQLAAMVLKFATERSAQSSQQRNLVEERISQLEQKQVDKLHQQADAMRASAWAAAIGKGLEATGKIAGGVCGLQGDTEAEQRAWDATGEIVQGAGLVGGAGGALFSGTLDANAKDLETDATALENRAKAQARALDQISADLDDARDLRAASFDFLSKVNEIRAETEQSLYIRG